MSLEGKQIGRYHIARLLGSGGMGDVYLAEDARVGQQVAIKVVRSEVTPYPNTDAARDAARIFEREIKAIVRLDHPNILPLFDYGEEQINAMPLIYLVMPYRQEGSLADWLRRRSKAELLSPQDVAYFVRQAADALQHAHERQIIHQDVKPSNFLMRSRKEAPTRPELLLADFGIAKITNATSSVSQSVRGTPTYMAPEQWESEPVPATDQYALAVMTYELLTGRPPFQGGPGRMMYQHLNAQPAPPSSLNPRLSREIDMVLLHALAKQAEQRFASITAFANAFQQAAQELRSANVSTLVKPAEAPSNSGDIRAALAISSVEALVGTTRTVTLPRGRKVTVSVPASVQDGQVIRLDGQGEVSSDGGPAGALILTIIIKQVDDSLATSNSVIAEQTALAATSAATGSDSQAVSNMIDQAVVSNTASQAMPSTVVPVTPSSSSPITGGSTRQTTVDARATQQGAKSTPQGGATKVPEESETSSLAKRTEAVPPTTGRGNHPTRQRSKRRPLLVVALVLLTILLVAGGTAYADPGVVTSLRNIVFPVLPPASSAKVIITPASVDLKDTYTTITAVTGTPDPSQNQVGAHILSTTIQAQTQTEKATGLLNKPATQATGEVQIINDNGYGGNSETFTSGMVIGPNKETWGPNIDIVLDQTVIIPASDINYTNVPAHVLQFGPVGNTSGFCFSTSSGCNSGSSGWNVITVTGFTGGQNLQNNIFVQQSDIDGTANAIIKAHTPDPRQVLQAQNNANEPYISAPQCKPKVSSDHAAGDKAANVTVSVSFTCTGEVYDDVAARTMAAQLLSNQAASDPGSGYALVGNIVTKVTQAKLVDAKQGTVALTVGAEGVWVYQFSPAQKQNLAKLIAGHKKQEAQNLLSGQAGVQQAVVQVSGGDGNTLPTDVSRITVVVQDVPGILTPTT